MTKLVEISGLNIRFTGERTVYAVNDLSLSLGDGEVLGLLGESGSGKSVTLRALMRLLPKKRTQISGSVNVLGRDVLALNDDELSAFRGQTVSMIFQEPALALDPVYTIGQQIAESVMRHEGKSQAEAVARALEMHLEALEAEQKKMDKPADGTNSNTSSNGNEVHVEDAMPPLSLTHLSVTGNLCPKCGCNTLVYEEGCRKCYSCGHSEC